MSGFDSACILVIKSDDTRKFLDTSTRQRMNVESAMASGRENTMCSVLRVAGVVVLCLLGARAGTAAPLLVAYDYVSASGARYDEPAPIPEPASQALVGVVLGVGISRRGRRAPV